MNSIYKFLAYITPVFFLLVLYSPAEAGKGQHHVGGKCVCKGCDNGKDLFGNCEVVCKDKEVYGKGNEERDYCKEEDKRGPQRKN